MSSTHISIRTPAPHSTLAATNAEAPPAALAAPATKTTTAASAFASGSDFWQLTAAAPPGDSRLDAAIRTAVGVRYAWKVGRLFARMAGLYVLAKEEGSGLASVDLSQGMKRKTFKLVEDLGRGGPVRPFLKDVKPITGAMRWGVGIARTVAAPPEKRMQKACEETAAFAGNRVANEVAHRGTIFAIKHALAPVATALHVPSGAALVAAGAAYALAPFGASIVGSRAARRGVRSLAAAMSPGWKPLQRVEDFEAGHADTRDRRLVSVSTEVARALAPTADGSVASSLPQRNHAALDALGFRLDGCSSTDVAVYRRDDLRLSLKPCSLDGNAWSSSRLDEIPLRMVIERMPGSGAAADTRPSCSMEAYLLCGGLFTPKQWAALKGRYHDELAAYERACAANGDTSHLPTDLASLKAFIATGQSPERYKKGKMEDRELRQESARLVRQLRALRNQGRAPSGIILYMEGLDCTGKSSTGEILTDALTEAGFRVETRGYNRPPTEEQKQRPWMDRFEPPRKAGHVRHWDRGPAGDFVFGKLATAPDGERQARYDEFRRAERSWRNDGVLMFKMMFVADRAAIVATIGKRLAHRRIARELQQRLGACSPNMATRGGLRAVETHIDSTDFIAFNAWESNLKRFVDFASNTGARGGQFPWLVVSTSNRHAARLALTRAFERQVGAFSAAYMPPSPSRDRAGTQARFNSAAGLFGVGLLDG